mmetsp:Transcript_74838/g.132176  ORF Transcript_74838/g.132176 Transcript_74838/m.132176 type:complete len:303 (+) Transcript_74838:951-1859(+)
MILVDGQALPDVGSGGVHCTHHIEALGLEVQGLQVVGVPLEQFVDFRPDQIVVVGLEGALDALQDQGLVVPAVLLDDGAQELHALLVELLPLAVVQLPRLDRSTVLLDVDQLLLQVRVRLCLLLVISGLLGIDGDELLIVLRNGPKVGQQDVDFDAGCVGRFVGLQLHPLIQVGKGLFVLFLQLVHLRPLVVRLEQLVRGNGFDGSSVVLDGRVVVGTAFHHGIITRLEVLVKSTHGTANAADLREEDDEGQANDRRPSEGFARKHLRWCRGVAASGVQYLGSCLTPPAGAQSNPSGITDRG